MGELVQLLSRNLELVSVKSTELMIYLIQSGYALPLLKELSPRDYAEVERLVKMAGFMVFQNKEEN